MLSKVAFLIACAWAIGGAILVSRQQRYEAASEMIRAIERGAEHDRTLWWVRGKIADGTSPQSVRTMAAALGPMRPIPRVVCEPESALAQAPASAPTQARQQIQRPAAPATRPQPGRLATIRTSAAQGSARGR